MVGRLSKRGTLYSLPVAVLTVGILNVLVALVAFAQGNTGESRHRGRLPYHPLSWSDFAVDDRSGGLSAQTQTFLTVHYTARAHPDSGPVGVYVATITGIAFDGGFDSDRSWRRSSVSLRNQLLLRHEQGHLDINELKLRQLRDLPLSAFPMGTGATPREAMKNLKSALAAAFAHHMEELNSLQRRYDDETDYGCRPATQTLWEQRIASLFGRYAPAPPQRFN